MWYRGPDSSQNRSYLHSPGWTSCSDALARSTLMLAVGIGTSFGNENTTWRKKVQCLLAKYFNKNKITWGLNICEDTFCINGFGSKQHNLPLWYPIPNKIHSPSRDAPSAGRTREPALGMYLLILLNLHTWSAERNITYLHKPFRWEWKGFFPPLNTTVYIQIC